MNIVYILTRSEDIGGASVHVRDLAQAMLADGHTVTVLVGGKGVFLEHIKDRKIPFISLNHLKREISPITDIKGFFEIKKHLKALKPDIVTTHSSKAGVLGRLAAHSLGIPVIFTAHGWAFTEGIPRVKRFLYKIVEGFMAKKTDKIITVSDYDRRLALKLGVGKKDQLVTIHNGIPDIESYYLAKPEKDPPRIIMVARFNTQKDYLTVTKALKLLEQYDWEAVFVGDGPDFENIKKIVNEFNLAGRIKFTGAIDNVHKELEQSQIFVLTSFWEGFPITIVEAMRAGLPIVASNVGGIKEAVFHGVNGYLVETGNPIETAEALEKLIVSSKLRKELGTVSRKLFKDLHLDFSSFKEQTFTVYREIKGKQIGP